MSSRLTYLVKVNSACCDAAESNPTQTSNVPGSNTHVRDAALQYVRSFAGIVSETVFVSPAPTVTFWNSFNSRRGREALPARWCVYICTTVAPLTADVFVTGTLTCTVPAERTDPLTTGAPRVKLE